MRKLKLTGLLSMIVGALALGAGGATLVRGASRPHDEASLAQEATPTTAPRPDRVELFDPDNPDVSRVLRGCADRRFADAESHLAVFKDGVCILDRGLRRVSAQTTHEKTGVIEETGLVDTAWVAPDGRGALLGMLRFTDRLQLDKGKAEAPDDGVHPDTTLTWIDPSFPDGSFEVALEPGRVVSDAEALSLGFGAAVMTQIHDATAVDFRLYSISGKLLFRVPEGEASASSITTSTLGGFVMVDLALVETPGGPDRALRVYDLLQGKWWDYTWAYGSDQEPLSWALADSGELEVRLPGATLRFDRHGKAVGGSKSAKGSRHGNGFFNRVRN